MATKFVLFKRVCHEEEEITAEHFVLASGSFFSKGLVSEFDKIYEPVFHSDIIGVEGFNDTDRFTWTDHRFSNPQPYQSAGVAINAQCQVQKSGQFLTNLYAVGKCDWWFQCVRARLWFRRGSGNSACCC